MSKLYKCLVLIGILALFILPVSAEVLIGDMYWQYSGSSGAVQTAPFDTQITFNGANTDDLGLYIPVANDGVSGSSVLSGSIMVLSDSNQATYGYNPPNLNSAASNIINGSYSSITTYSNGTKGYDFRLNGFDVIVYMGSPKKFTSLVDGNYRYCTFLPFDIVIGSGLENTKNLVNIYLNFTFGSYNYDVVGNFTSLSVVDDTGSQMVDAIQALQSALDGGLSDIVGALSTNSDVISSALEEQSQIISAKLDDVKAAIQDMQQDDGWMEEFIDLVEQKTNEAAAKAVADIQGALQLDVSGFQSSVDQLMNALSSHSTTANLTIPAGTVVLSGVTYTFWDEIEFSFDDYFDYDIVQLMLLPLRFLFVWGMIKYVLYWVGKIEKLVTLNVSGGDE